MAQKITQKTIKKWCDLWQRRLNLLEWSITIRFAVSEEDLNIVCEGCYGATYWHPDEQSAVVLIGTGFDEKATHETVIHELLHLLVNGHQWPSKNNVTNERIVKKLTTALYNATHPAKCSRKTSTKQS